MTLGINSLKNLSSSNPVAPLQAPQAPVQKPSEPVQTRVQAQPQAPAPHAGAALTDTQAIANFDHQISGLKVPELQAQVAEVASGTQMPEFLKHVLGQESVGAEVHGALSIGGGYAGNTIGGICELGKDPTVLSGTPSSQAYNASSQVTSDDTKKWLISGNNATDSAGNSLNDGAKVAASFGIFVSVLGLVNSSMQLDKGITAENVSTELGARGKFREDTAQLLDKVNVAADQPGALSPEQRAQLQTKLNDIASLLETGLQNDKLAPDARQFMQVSLDRINAVKNHLPNPPDAAVQTLSTHLKADAAALANLSKITKNEANLDQLMGSIGIVSNLNGLANGGLTIMSIVHSTGTTLGNQAAHGLILTQAVSGVGMIATGLVGVYQDSRAIHKAEARLERLGTYERAHPTLAPGAASAQAIQEREKVADVGKLVKTESTNTISSRIWSRLKNIATVVAGVALTVGVCVAAAAFVASPIGWAVGGLAAVAGIGLACVKLYQKYNQQKTIDTLDGQHQRVSTEVKTLKAEQARLNGLPAVVQARLDKPEYDRHTQELPVNQGTARDLRAQVAGLKKANEDAETQIQSHSVTLDNLRHDLAELTPKREGERAGLLEGIAASERIISQNQRIKLDNTERLVALEPRLNTAEAAVHTARLRLEALAPGQDLLSDLTRIEAALPAREALQGQIEGRLRQVSPDHATRDLVRMIQAGSQDAKDFAQQVLKIPPDALRGATPAILAELIRKNIGAAYL